jgi:soluble lytic murein transglycosylase-like protein
MNYPSGVEQAARPEGKGCLFRFFLPPISVILMGTLLALILSQVNFNTASTAPQSTAPSTSDGGIAPLFTPQVQAWEGKILQWSERYQLDPNLVATVMQIESCGNPKALSPAGAQGLFQVMPYHFQTGEDPLAPGINARRGLNYLRGSLEAGGNVRLALAGYNGGIQGASRPQESWPAETKRYVYWGSGIYKDAKNTTGEAQE